MRLGLFSFCFCICMQVSLRPSPIASAHSVLRPHRWIQIVMQWNRPLAAFIPWSRISASWWSCRRLCVWHHGLCTDIWQNWQICWLLFSTYVETTTFPPSLWAQIPSDVHRTNNGPESFHRHFCCQFISPHPRLRSTYFRMLLFGSKL